MVSTDKNSWGPRLGFAYTFDSKTVIRGGYGLYYEFQEIGPWSFPSPGYNPPFNVVWFPTDPTTGRPNVFSQGYSLDFTDDPSVQFQIAAIPAHMHTPRVQQWNLAVEREISANTLLSLDYSGSAGHNLYTLIYFDQALLDAHRSPLLVISPHVRRRATEHAHFSTASVLKTIEQILGLRSLTYFDDRAPSLLVEFDPKPALDTYSAVRPRVPMDEVNSNDAPGAKESEQWDFSRPDLAPEQELTRVIWKSIKGRDSEPPAPILNVQSRLALVHLTR